MQSVPRRALRGVLPLYVLLALTRGAGVHAASDQEVTIDGGAAPLHGSLVVPDRPGPRVAVLLVPGSGPTDRDGNAARYGATPNTLKLLAFDLAQGEIASLRFDKRGIGASAPALSTEAAIKLGTEVSDVIDWARFLHSRLPHDCVILLGHSEGALIASMAAREFNTCGVILLAGAGRPAGALLKAQLAARSMPESLRNKAFNAIDTLESGQPVPDVPPALMALFRPSLQPYMTSWLPVDPAKEVAALHTPVLVVQGEGDTQVSIDDARLLAKSNPAARLVLLPGVNHELKDIAPADTAHQTATDPEKPLDIQAVRSIVEFVKHTARPR